MVCPQPRRQAGQLSGDHLRGAHSRPGHDFGQYKANTPMCRVRRRMQVLHIEDPDEYIAQLRKLPNEPDLLFQEIPIGVTRFFRDATMFEALAEPALREPHAP